MFDHMIKLLLHPRATFDAATFVRQLDDCDARPRRLQF